MIAVNPPSPPTAQSLPSIFGGIRPRARWREFGLLGLVGLTLVVGSISLGSTARFKAGTDAIAVADPTLLVVYLGALLAAHTLQVLAGRRTDQPHAGRDRAGLKDAEPRSVRSYGPAHA